MNGIEISWIGAIIALVIAISLILFKVPVFFGMMAGALIGGIVGFIIYTAQEDSSNQHWQHIISTPVNAMFDGGKKIMTVVLRILASGVLAGALIHTGAAKAISHKLVKLMGARFVLLGLTITTLVLTASGVFVDIAVITVAPIAITVAKESKLSRSAILIAMIGGGKAGNLMSPNPNAISASDNFHVSLIKVMSAGAIIAIVGITVTFLVAYLKNKADRKNNYDIIKHIDGEAPKQKEEKLPSFFLSILGPLVAIMILVIRPLTEGIMSKEQAVIIDPLIALPVGGFITILVLGRAKETLFIVEEGLKRMIPVAIMLAGTGMLSGIITNSDLKDQLIKIFQEGNIPTWILAPISGLLFGFATASTTAGTTVASSSFASVIGGGVGGAAMTHAGAVVLDSSPHGSFFHSTAGAVKMNARDRLKLLLLEVTVGGSLAIASTIIFGIIGLSF